MHCFIFFIVVPLVICPVVQIVVVGIDDIVVTVRSNRRNGCWSLRNHGRLLSYWNSRTQLSTDSSTWHRRPWRCWKLWWCSCLRNNLTSDQYLYCHAIQSLPKFTNFSITEIHNYIIKFKYQINVQLLTSSTQIPVIINKYLNITDWNKAISAMRITSCPPATTNILHHNMLNSNAVILMLEFLQ